MSATALPATCGRSRFSCPDTAFVCHRHIHATGRDARELVLPTHQHSDQAESVLLVGLVREQVAARAREQVARGVDVEIEFIPRD